jgi:hypothetical protein
MVVTHTTSFAHQRAFEQLLLFAAVGQAFGDTLAELPEGPVLAVA